MENEKKEKVIRYTKVLTLIPIIHGMILTTLSYALAYLGRDPVVSVSEVIVREIVAPVVVYLTVNMVCNIFEKNKLSFSIPLTSLEDNYNRCGRPDEEVEG